MKTLSFDSIKNACAKGLFAFLLLTGLFIFSHQAASSQICNSKQTTEYVQADNRPIKGLKYRALSCRHSKMAATATSLFRKTDLSRLHSNNASTRLKLTLQSALNKSVHSQFHFVKSIPQSGKNDPSATFS